ncbi:hypothetical protein D3C72_2568530 [compost metagenome]
MGAEPGPVFPAGKILRPDHHAMQLVVLCQVGVHILVQVFEVLLRQRPARVQQQDTFGLHQGVFQHVQLLQ